MTGPRVCGVLAPHWIGKRWVPALGSGCEVSRIWVERLDEVMIVHPERKKAPQTIVRRACQILTTLGNLRQKRGGVNERAQPSPGWERVGCESMRGEGC